MKAAEDAGGGIRILLLTGEDYARSPRPAQACRRLKVLEATADFMMIVLPARCR